MKLKLLDLFSGIGGFSLGLESTEFFETIAFVEKDKFCQKVLKKNFNNIPIEEDIRNVKGDRYAADVITGGFPCQPFSIAGKRKGTDDDRYLWDETIRVIRECKPRWFIGENVEGIINIQEGMVLRQVQSDLEEEGFEVQCIIIPASGIGAWHQRKRVWILAYSNNNGSYRSQGNETKQSSNEQKDRLSFRDDKNVSNSDSIRHGRWSSKGCTNERWSFLPRKQEGREMGSEAQRCDGDDANTNSYSKTNRGKCKINEKPSSEWKFNKGRSISYGRERCISESWETPHVQHTNNKRSQEFNLSKESEKQNINSREYDSTTENKTWWQTQSELCGVPNGVSYELDKDRANRIKSLGNSIVPLIARQLGLAIMKAEQE